MKEGGLVVGKSHSEGGEDKNLEDREYVIRKPAVELSALILWIESILLM